MTFMSEYSPLSGTVRSYDERAELEEPCTRNRTGSGCPPALGAPTRLRQRLSRTLRFWAQYSALQIGSSVSCAAAASVIPAGATAERPDTNPTPAPRPAPAITVRRAKAWSAGGGFLLMAFSVRFEQGAIHSQ